MGRHTVQKHSSYVSGRQRLRRSEPRERENKGMVARTSHAIASQQHAHKNIHKMLALCVSAEMHGLRNFVETRYQTVRTRCKQRKQNNEECVQPSSDCCTFGQRGCAHQDIILLSSDIMKPGRHDYGHWRYIHNDMRCQFFCTLSARLRRLYFKLEVSIIA